MSFYKGKLTKKIIIECFNFFLWFLNYFFNSTTKLLYWINFSNIDRYLTINLNTNFNIKYINSSNYL